MRGRGGRECGCPCVCDHMFPGTTEQAQRHHSELDTMMCDICLDTCDRRRRDIHIPSSPPPLPVSPVKFFSNPSKYDVHTRVPALPAGRQDAGGVNCVIRCHHLRPGALASRAKLSHDAAVSGRGRWGPEAPTPPALRGPAIGGCGNWGCF